MNDNKRTAFDETGLWIKVIEAQKDAEQHRLLKIKYLTNALRRALSRLLRGGFRVDDDDVLLTGWSTSALRALVFEEDEKAATDKANAEALKREALEKEEQEHQRAFNDAVMYGTGTVKISHVPQEQMISAPPETRTEYRILKTIGAPGTLEEYVQAHLDEGWTLHGAPVALQGGLMQAVVREMEVSGGQ